MPYQKTKEGRLVNEITLGDGYPLSNDKQPLKVGGEASIINVSSPTPDGSLDGEVEVKGKLRAKDTFIQGDLKVFSDSDTSPQFRFESRAGQNCQLQVKSAANTLTQLQLNNNQGSWYLKRLSSTTSLQFNDGTNTPLILDGDNVEFTNLTDGSITIDSFVDEDNMSSNSATKIPTQQSVKAYVDNEVAGLVDSAPAALDTLNELAAALNDDASFSTTITNSLALKAPLAAPAFTGDATFDSTTLAIDSSNNRVGIGTTSPDDALDIGISGSDARIYFSGNAGGGGSGILYKDSGGSARYALHFEDDDKVILSNRASNGTVQIRANTSTAGASGEQTIATFEDDKVGIGTTSPDTPLHVIGETSIQPVNYANNQDAFLIKGGASNNDSWDGHVGVKFKSTSGGVPYLVLRATNSDTLAVRQSKVGIGTESPDALLELQDDANTFARINTSGSGLNSGVQFYDNDVYKWQVYNKASDDSLRFKGSSDFVSIDSSGNVGIGTTSPSSELHISTSSPYPSLLLESTGASANIMRFTTTDGTFTVGQDYDDNFSIANAANITSDRVFTILKSNGNVGIGTTSPQSLLHVEEGDIRIDTAQNGTQALRFSDRNGTEGQLQYNSQYLKLRMLTDAADGTDTKRLTVLGGQDATAVGIGTDDPTTTLDVEGTVSYKHIAFTTAGPTDNVDVSGTTVLEVDTSGGSVTIGGFTGGVQGQILYVVKTTSDTYTLKLENNEGGGSQDIFSSDNADISLVRIRGGVTLYCNGTSWFVLNK